MTALTNLFAEFDDFARKGFMRRLGCSFARLIADLGAKEPCVLLCSALLSELEGRGHSCLMLEELANDPCALLGWQKDRWECLQAAAGTLPATVEAWQQVLSQCDQIWVAGTIDLNQPMVLDEDRLYLRRYWRDETLVAKSVAARVERRRDVDVAKVRHWLDILFDPLPAGEGIDWQKTACAIAVRGTFSIITGGPGTGKTYTVARLLALLFALADHPEKLRIALAAPTGKAATNLKESIDDALTDLAAKVGDALPLADLTARMAEASTLHSLLGARPDTRAVVHHAANPLEVDVLIVDEASMVHLEMMSFILDSLPANAVVIQLGDKDQLASVEAGAVLGDLCFGAQQGNYDRETAEYVMSASGQTLPDNMVCGGTPLAQQTVMLRRSRRFGGPIGALATAVNAGEADVAADLLRKGAGQVLKWYEHAQPETLLQLAVYGRPGAEGGFTPYLKALKQGPAADGLQEFDAWALSVLQSFDTFRLLCAVRDGDWGVEGINAAVEKRLERDGWIKRRSEWYVGRPVMVTRNDYGLGVNNGDIGITLPDPTRAGALRVYFLKGEGVRSVLATRLSSVETAFAMTVHKAQGAEYQHATLVLPKESGLIVARELVYTGITRAKSFFTLVTPVSDVFIEAVLRQTVRASGLRSLLQRYSAEQRP